MPNRSPAKAPNTAMRETRRAIALGCAVTIIIVLVQALGWFAPLETSLASWRFHIADRFAPEPPSDKITILAIDDGALATWGEWGDWPRERIARLIDLLNQLGAHTIALDVRFETSRDDAGDAALADAMRRHGNVIIAVSETQPIEPIASAAAAFGSVAFDDTSPGVLLEVPRVAHGTAQFGLVAAARFEQRGVPDDEGDLLVPWTDKHGEGAVGFAHWSKALPVPSIGPAIRMAQEIPLLEQTVSALLERNVTWPINDAVIAEAHDEAMFIKSELGGPPQNIINQLDAVPNRSNEQQRTLTAAQLVAAMDRLEERWAGPEQYGLTDYQRLEGYVRDRLVFIGWTATGAIADFVATPLGARTPGVVVHAQIAAGELTGFHKRRWPGFVGSLAITALLGMLGTAIACASPRRTIFLGMFALLAYTLINAFVLFDALGLLVTLAPPLIACAGALAATASVRAAAVHRDRAAIRRQFRARIDPKLAERLERHPEEIKLDGELREISVVFTDLSGYSALAEQYEPAKVVSLLNALQTTVAESLIEHGGYINKFLGDGIMALWGAPQPRTDHAPAACRAVLEAQQRLAQRAQELGVHLALRAGVSSGDAIVGDCGAPPRLNDYTAIGDVVNIAARLADVGAALGTPLLMTRPTAEAALGAHVRCLGPMQLPGRAQPVRVWQLCQTMNSTDALRQAIARFDTGDYASAGQAWRDAARADPSLTLLARRWVKRCDELAHDASGIKALIVDRA